MNSVHSGLTSKLSDAAPSMVLIVEDDSDVQTLFERQLTALGCSVQAVSGLDELVDRLISVTPDLIILDLSLGSSDAIEAFHFLVQSAYHGQIVLTSGHALSVLQHARCVGERLGLSIAGCLKKPVRLADLRRVLESGLA